ncbi:hypothetical protein B0H10DRAFT_587232 [Mycena sp. CBHHK59/15]|nr:hypothetical protein B0H10DRAFT_587232 [Mycena sp. CBHHK59/15]
MHSACRAPALEPTCALASRRPRRNKYVLESPLRDERPADHTGGGAGGKNWTSPSTDPKEGTEDGTRTAALPSPIHAEAEVHAEDRASRPGARTTSAAGDLAAEKAEAADEDAPAAGGVAVKRQPEEEDAGPKRWGGAHGVRAERAGTASRRPEMKERDEPAPTRAASTPGVVGYDQSVPAHPPHNRDVRIPSYTHAPHHMQALATRVGISETWACHAGTAAPRWRSPRRRRKRCA